MSKKINKIGLIQNSPLPGDFSTNLRSIVQGYRECLDHGAEVVVAPAAALCGLEPGNLATRSSFIGQTNAALDALSKELGHAPLILAAYTMVVSDDELYVGIVGEDDESDDAWMSKDRRIVLTPYLIEKDCVTELENCGLVEINGMKFYTETSDVEMLPDCTPDFMVRMPCTPWYGSAVSDDAETRSWEANMSGCTVICCRPVGTASGHIYAGGSAVYSKAGEVLQRLPFFEPANKVVDISRKPMARHLPDSVELMSSALERGIRDNVRQNGFTGVCIPLDYPNSALLGALCVEALGVGNVCGITFGENLELAEKLGISYFNPPLGELKQAAIAALGNEENNALVERLKTTLALTHAESRGLMLCSPIGRRQIMLGEFNTYGETGGYLAPLGNLYDVDIYMLSEWFKEKYASIFGSLTEPPHGNTNRIIHELADRNTPPSLLLNAENNYLFKENDVRIIQRKLLASALKRTQLPIILHADAPDEQLSFPVSHRFND